MLLQTTSLFLASRTTRSAYFTQKSALLLTAIENVTRYTRNVEKKRHTKLLLGSYISKIAIQSIVLGLQSNKYETKQRGI